jgi:hypothetical protein
MLTPISSGISPAVRAPWANEAVGVAQMLHHLRHAALHDLEQVRILERGGERADFELVLKVGADHHRGVVGVVTFENLSLRVRKRAEGHRECAEAELRLLELRVEVDAGENELLHLVDDLADGPRADEGLHHRLRALQRVADAVDGLLLLGQILRGAARAR